MEINLHAKAMHLLEKIANSVYERYQPHVVCFSAAEVKLVEKWLEEFITETQK